jgi:hypothetical protein
MNSVPLSESIPRIGNGNRPNACCSAASTHFWAFVRHGAVHRPAGGDICDGQREAVLPGRGAAFVADEIDFHEPGHRVVPIRPGPDRDLGLQQGPGLRMEPAPQYQRPGLDQRDSLPLAPRQSHPSRMSAPGTSRTFSDEATYRPPRTFPMSQRGVFPSSIFCSRPCQGCPLRVLRYALCVMRYGDGVRC